MLTQNPNQSHSEVQGAPSQGVVPHTPGPWKALVTHGVGIEHTAMVATTAPNHKAIDAEGSGSTRQEDHANAHLIAAAPELLSIVQTLYDWWGLGEQGSHNHQAPISASTIFGAENDIPLANPVIAAIQKAKAGAA